MLFLLDCGFGGYNNQNEVDHSVDLHSDCAKITSDQ